MATAPRDHEGTHDDTVEIPAGEITQVDDDWPVSQQYLVAPKVPPEGAPPNGGQRTLVSPATPRRRRFPPFVSDFHPALLVPLAALLVATPLAAWLLAGGDAPAESAPPAAVTTSPPTTASPPTTTQSRQAKQVGVPDLEGMTVAEARSALDEAGLRARVRTVSSQQPKGEVLAQSPDPGSDVAGDSVVTLTASGGPNEIEVDVPDVVGLTAADATRALREAGLRREAKAVTSEEPAGTVLSQSPAAGKTVDPETTVTIRVAQAPPTVDAPRLVGLTAADAKNRLRELGLRWRVTEVNSERPQSTVLGQTPSAGTDLRKGEMVVLEVSAGSELVRVPDVTGQDEWLARPRLVRLGFEVIIVDEPTTDLAQDGIVLSQDPVGGKKLEKGSTITLTVARFS